MKRWIGLCLMGVFLAPAPAKAACSPLAGCACLVTASGVSFGTYDPLSSSSTDATGTVRVVCTLLLEIAGSFTIDLSAGNSGSFSERNLRQGANNLRYNLYTDAAYTTPWGDGTGGSTRVTRNFGGLLLVTDTVSVYGRIQAGQNVAAGIFSDLIIVTVTY